MAMASTPSGSCLREFIPTLVVAVGGMGLNQIESDLCNPTRQSQTEHEGEQLVQSSLHLEPIACSKCMILETDLSDLSLRVD